MTDPGKQKNSDNEKKEDFPEKEKNWDNPKDPEATEDIRRDKEQLERQIEEAKRRKENLTEEDNN